MSLQVILLYSAFVPWSMSLWTVVAFAIGISCLLAGDFVVVLRPAVFDAPGTPRTIRGVPGQRLKTPSAPAGRPPGQQAVMDGLPAPFLDCYG
ncbi:Uncharacterized protein KF715C_ch36710 [Pseudomonas putida]|uniref:Uncharacterized protein n=1 Tax=Pseudomonas putida TaxID=303 RepID=A0A1L7NFM9_PSEPU|nr:Uncharacterized protein KF715C_ch36710 [Pseudomonas putida]GLO20013.1 hypothetical protein PPUJ20188_34100 [Pseudomonas putida]